MWSPSASEPLPRGSELWAIVNAPSKRVSTQSSSAPNGSSGGGHDRASSSGGAGSGRAHDSGGIGGGGSGDGGSHGGGGGASGDRRGGVAGGG